MFRRMIAGAAVAALAIGGVLLTPPTPAWATVTGVATSINWSSTDPTGDPSSELRTLVGDVIFSRTGTLAFNPVIGMTDLCRTSTACTGSDVVPRSAMKIAFQNKGDTTGCNTATTTCWSTGCALASGWGGTTGVNHGPFTSSPATKGTGAAPPGPVFPLCNCPSTQCNPTTYSTGLSSWTSTSYVRNIEYVQLANVYLAVVVPSSVNPGTYTGTLTFGVRDTNGTE